MIDITNWNLYWNAEGTQQVRANLVYSAYVSPDRKSFCQWFARDPKYHPHSAENQQWTEELLEDRFRKELKYHTKATRFMPTLPILDVDERARKIVFAWPGDDFLMQSINAGSREAVISDWKEQWVDLIIKMWKANITKLSLHPNSWTVSKGRLVPFNWFFCYDTDTDKDSFANLLIQISPGRLEKMHGVLSKLGMTIDEMYAPAKLQLAAFNSFRSNYDDELIDSIIEKLNEENNRNTIVR